MALVDINGNPIGGASSILNGADVFVFGDSNAYYSYGNSLSQVGSFYQRLSLEFTIKSWSIAGTAPGRNTWQTWSVFNQWATAENATLYNKENTIILFVAGTNDPLNIMTPDYNGNPNTTSATNGIYFIAQKCAELFPRAQWHWILPTQMDWQKFAGDSGIDFSERDIDPKIPYLLKHLQANAFPYCDMRYQSGVQASMLPDGVHLGGGGYNFNTAACDKYYHALRRYLMNLLGGIDMTETEARDFLKR